jgi:hypothetical protein
MTHIKYKTIIGAVLLGAAACGGSVQMPPDQLAQADSSIRAATDAGAMNYPDAAMRLQVAKTSTERAQKAAHDGNADAAKALLNDAQADADLSLALTRAQQAQARSNDARSRLESLQQ